MAKSEEINVLDQCLLDRFVDGELTDDEERAVLEQLDQATDGWRQFALTFAESRVWQREIHFLQSATPERVQPASTSNRNHWRNAPAWTSVLTVLAVVFLAFAVGTYFPHASGIDRSATGESGQQIADSAKSFGKYGNLVSNSGPTPIDRQQDLVRQLEHDSVGSLSLVSKAGEQIDVPVFDVAQQDADEFLQGSTLLPPELVQSLKRYEIRRRPSYVPVQLEDGRRVVVPMQVFDVVPVGGTAY